MISMAVTADAEVARRYLVTVVGRLEDRTALNKVLAFRLRDELRDHYAELDTKPNKLGGDKTHFWARVAKSTDVAEFTATGAVVSVSDVRYKIQLFGGTVKPVNGKFLTIPLIAGAHGMRVAEYEKKTGKKLFRTPFGRVLYERGEAGDRTFIGAQKVTVRGNKSNRGGYNSIAIRERSRVRAVYALKEQVTISKDPAAFPDPAKLLESLQDEASGYAEDLNERSLT